MTKISELPKELLDKIKAAFDAEPRVRQLRVQQQMLMRNGKYQDALDVAKYIERFTMSVCITISRNRKVRLKRLMLRV